MAWVITAKLSEVVVLPLKLIYVKTAPGEKEQKVSLGNMLAFGEML